MDGEINEHAKKVLCEGVGQKYYCSYKDSISVWGKKWKKGKFLV